MDKVVRMKDVSKSYGAKRALDGFDLEIEKGRVVGLLGLNGAGKSTAMRLMTGLLKADRGTIEVLGRDPWRMEPADRRRIGYLSEKDFPFPELDMKGADGDVFVRQSTAANLKMTAFLNDGSGTSLNSTSRKPFCSASSHES